MRNKLTIRFFIAVSVLFFCLAAFASGLVSFNALPKAAQKTVQLIKQNGPFPYEKDGMVFGNYERLLPKKKRGYYHEYTVPTPGTDRRGAHRIVVGGNPPTSSEFYYTADHYATFRLIQFPGK